MLWYDILGFIVHFYKQQIRGQKQQQQQQKK